MNLRKLALFAIDCLVVVAAILMAVPFFLVLAAPFVGSAWPGIL